MSNKLDSLDDFTRQYIETALWSSNDESTPSGGEPLDKNYGVDDVDDKSLYKMIADCEKFQVDNKSMLDEAYNGPKCTCNVDGAPASHEKTCAVKRFRHYNDENAGHDFWLTRNRLGAGFWDGDLPKKVGDALTLASHVFKEISLYIGDDGKIYQS